MIQDKNMSGSVSGQEPENREPENEECVVVHFKDGSILKGRLVDSTTSMENFTVRPEDVTVPDTTEQIKAVDLKAIYYVKDFYGNREYSEKKQFGLTSSMGKRVMVRFKDGEILCGFVKGEIVGDDASVSSLPKDSGFFLYPADPNANNSKIFVVVSSVVDIRRL